MRSRPSRRDAMSLLEVVVAMAVFMISLIGLMELLSAGGRLATDGQKRSQAGRLCQSKMAELQAGAIPLEGQGETPFDEDPDYVWSVESNSGPAQNLYSVTVSVKCTRPGSDALKISLSQLMLDPKIAGSVQDAAILTADTSAPEVTTDSTTTPTQSGSSNTGNNSKTGGGNTGGGNTGGGNTGGGNTGGGKGGGGGKS